MDVANSIFDKADHLIEFHPWVVFFLAIISIALILNWIRFLRFLKEIDDHLKPMHNSCKID